MLRSLAERLSRGIILKRRLPARFGRAPIFVSPEASLRYWRWNLEKVDPRLFDLIEEFVHPGCTVWDVGANVGVFSFASAARAGHSGKVLAVEPDTWLVGLLRESARIACAGVASVDVLPAAVSDRNDVARLHIANRCRAANYLGGEGSTQAGGSRAEEIVLSITLDWLAERYPRPSVLKIDTEGCEAKVLAGGEKLLSTARPLLICEVSPGNAPAVTTLLHSLGYGLFDADEARACRTSLNSAAWNTLAIPSDVR